MIPAQVDQITVDWLNEHLDDDIGTIVEVAIEHIGEGVGILGEVARLTLTYADQHSGPATLIAKCQSIHPENVVISQLMGFYEREVNFYSQVAAKLTVRTPHCYIAEMADGGTPFVLVIEAIEGGSMIDQVVGATLEESLAIARTVAALHSDYWETDALHAMTWLPPMNNDLYKGAGALVAANWAEFVNTWSGSVPPQVIDWCGQLTPRYSQMLDWWTQNSPATFTHTDCRAENYLFGGSAGDGVVTMLDFQLSTRHVGTWDIANFLGMSVTVANRRAWEHDIVTHYHDELVAAGVVDYDFATCWRDYRYCLLHQAWTQVAVANIDPGNERGRLLLNEFVMRSFHAAADNNSGEFLTKF
ncbi:phosphotransferase [uncultured Ilumatobacter sp.]|jgi:aminoglycoside/choline kinase family phosphotransferase|uniref:phosphotransferase n=1 Tax=uncultured Ilumatobacter sp. TaxID=879968 RepID=UPI00374E2826